MEKPKETEQNADHHQKTASNILKGNAMDTNNLLAGIIEYVQGKKPTSGCVVTILDKDGEKGTKIWTGCTHNIKDPAKLFRRIADDIDGNECIKCKMNGLGDLIQEDE